MPNSRASRAFFSPACTRRISSAARSGGKAGLRPRYGHHSSGYGPINSTPCSSNSPPGIADRITVITDANHSQACPSTLPLMDTSAMRSRPAFSASMQSIRRLTLLVWYPKSSAIVTAGHRGMPTVHVAKNQHAPRKEALAVASSGCSNSHPARRIDKIIKTGRYKSCFTHVSVRSRSDSSS
jgi:hypothetical protein